MRKVLWLLMAVLFGFNGSHTFAQSLDAEYRLGAGDTISIKVFGEDDLSVETLVSDTGVLKYPFLGDVTIAGKTTSELQQTIDTGLRGDYLVNPSVTVAIVSYRPFFIQGEVKSPGAIAFQPGLTVSKAITLAGGFTDRASRTNIKVVRANDKDHKEVKIDLTEPVTPGDLIIVEDSFF